MFNALLFLATAASSFAAPLLRQQPTSNGHSAASKRDGLLAERQLAGPRVGTASVTMAGGSYPRMARLTDGSLLASLTLYHGEGQQSIDLFKSPGDNGASFSHMSTAVSESNGNDLDNGHFVQLPSSTSLGGHRILVAFRNHTRQPDGSYSFYRLGACYSDDLGETFHGCNNIVARPADGVNGLWEPFLRVTNSGNVQVFYASENGDYDQDVLAQTSFDGGKTWGAAITVSGAGIQARDGMPGVSSYIDGRDGQQKLICVFESTLSPKAAHQGFRVFSVTSDDDGLTWGGRSIVYAPTGIANNAGSPQVTTTVFNEVVVSFMTDEDTQEHEWIRGADMKIVVSQPPSPAAPLFSWSDKTTVFTPQANWPGLLALGDGSVLGAAVFQNVATVKRISF